MLKPITIEKKPLQPESSDYDLLRSKGIEHIRDLGSAIWTDYNIHDPGITFLEALCYAITDLGYRTSLDIKHLLAEPEGKTPKYNFDKQGFFTAREILTISPWTVADYRKLLIDLEGVKNAWLVCKNDCTCDGFDLYINCKKNKLSYTIPEHDLMIKGFYDVLIEFENDKNGDLNSGKIKQDFRFPLDGTNEKFTTATIEIRFPTWQEFKCKSNWEPFRQKKREIDSISITSFSRKKDTSETISDEDFSRALRRPVFIDLTIKFKPIGGESVSDATLELKDVPITIWFTESDDRAAIKKVHITKLIEDLKAGGVVARYFEKLLDAEEVMKKVFATLHSHRNLCEDFCHINAIEITDVAVCADIEMHPDADIEKVTAEIYYVIEQYFSPDIKFYSLKQLIDEGRTIDQIFEGPKLSNGFIDNDQLESTQLKAQLRTSDIINLLMDIKGVKAVSNIALVEFDRDGKNIGSHPWVLNVTAVHQPRFYAEASKFLVFKNSLSFLPNRKELADTLQIIKGKNLQHKLSVYDIDLPVPQGEYYELNAYYPVQYSLPQTYGVGYEGLPSNVTVERKAQAKQLKAYLLFFEQLLVNYMEQLSHVKELFAIDESVKQTYFTKLFTDDDIAGVNEILNGLTKELLEGLAEEPYVYLDRKNRFLDHLMARFAEQFNDYALMLFSYLDNQSLAEDKLIEDKISFLKDLPFMSYNKARSFNYKDGSLVCNDLNIAGLQMRIEKILGIQSLKNYFEITTTFDKNTKKFISQWELRDDDGTLYLISNSSLEDADKEKAEKKALANIDVVLANILVDSRYLITGAGEEWNLYLQDKDDNKIAARPRKFKKESASKAQKEKIIKFADTVISSEKIYIVEHILIRPHHKPQDILNPLPSPFDEQDSLLTICVEPNCEFCGEEDPYSFRLTIVMNGEGGLANAGITFRRFAEQAIRQEIPAHIGVKICWVIKDDLKEPNESKRNDLTHFSKAWCDYLGELAKYKPDPIKLYEKLVALLKIFKALKSTYPPATLHDCADGNDENRVFLNQTIIGKK